MNFNKYNSLMLTLNSKLPIAVLSGDDKTILYVINGQKIMYTPEYSTFRFTGTNKTANLSNNVQRIYTNSLKEFELTVKALENLIEQKNYNDLNNIQVSRGK